MEDGRRVAALVVGNGIVAWVAAHLSVARLEHVHVGVGGVWVAVAVAAATAAVALAVLRRGARWRVAALALLAVVAMGMGRAQVGVHNAELVRTLIPLQSESIRACEAAAVTAPDLVQWCQQLVVDREREIWELQRILRRY